MTYNLGVAGSLVRQSMSELSDAELIDLCLQGDAASWEALIRRYQNLIYSVPVSYRFSAVDAADIFQSVCVILMEKLRTLRHSETLASWLYVTTRRQCWKTHRKASREVEMDDHSEFVVEPEAEDLVLQHQVRAGMSHLSEKCRQLLSALYYADPPLSYEEIAAQLGVPYGSIGPNRARCLERLRKILGKNRI